MPCSGEKALSAAMHLVGRPHIRRQRGALGKGSKSLIVAASMAVACPKDPNDHDATGALCVCTSTSDTSVLMYDG